MKKIFKITGYAFLGLVICLYLAFLFILPNKINLNKEKSVVSDYQASYAKYCAIEYIMQTNGFDFSSRLSDTDYTTKYEEAYNEALHQLKSKGYSIYTSLDPVKQTQLQESINSGLEFNQEVDDDDNYALQSAGTLIDNESGLVVAIVGGRHSTSYYLSIFLFCQLPL